MPENDSKSLDVLGVKPVGEAFKLATERTLDGAGAFLSRICLPAAEEIGLLLKERVGHWRARQAARIAEKTQAKLDKFPRGSVHALPRLVFKVLEDGSWCDDDAIQEAWAGILASACTPEGKDDSNVIFASLLTQLTGVQLRILNHCVEETPKFVSSTGIPYASQPLSLAPEQLGEISGCTDISRLDREMDHLRSLELIGLPGGEWAGGFEIGPSLIAKIGITPLAIYLYVRGQGFIGSPAEYFDLKEEPPPEPVTL